MGACATKPKVSKEDGQAPVPAPEPVPTETTTVEDVVPAKTEEQNVLPVVKEEKEKGKKVAEAKVVDENNKVDDDQDSKRRSLSHLFKENENEKLEEAEKAPAEVMKQESSETVKSKELALEEQSVDPPTELVAPEPILIQESVQPTKQEKLETEKPEELLKQEQSEKSTNELEKQEMKMTEIPLEKETIIEALVTEKPVESVVKQEPSVTEKSIEVLETNEKSEIPIEPTESLTVVDAPAKVIEATPAVEPKTNDEKSGEKKIEETKDLKISA